MDLITYSMDLITFKFRLLSLVQIFFMGRITTPRNSLPLNLRNQIFLQFAILISSDHGMLFESRH